MRGQVKVSVSDPTRTILDLLSDPALGGGIRSTMDILINKAEIMETPFIPKHAVELTPAGLISIEGAGLYLKASKRIGYIKEGQAKYGKGARKSNRMVPPARS